MRHCNLMVIPERASLNKTDMLGEPLTGSSSGKTLHTLLIRVIDFSTERSLSRSARQSQHSASLPRQRAQEKAGVGRLAEGCPAGLGHAGWRTRSCPTWEYIFSCFSVLEGPWALRRSVTKPSFACESCLFAFCLRDTV